MLAQNHSVPTPNASAATKSSLFLWQFFAVGAVSKGVLRNKGETVDGAAENGGRPRASDGDRPFAKQGWLKGGGLRNEG